MQIVESIEELAQAPRGAVLSVGNFDGVHRAHQAVLACVQEAARKAGAAAGALTFEPHPLRILRPQSAPPLITPRAEKIRRLADTGLDFLVVLPFTRDLSLFTPREFVERVLVRGLGIAAAHEGATFQFGHRHAGTVATLEALGHEFGFAVHTHAEMRIRGETVSSSRVRAALGAGRVALAARLLGRCFSVRGPIARGRGLGHRLTVPTLNLQHYEELLPAAGVYVTETAIGGRAWPSATNVGVRPTFGVSSLTVETHLLEEADAPPPVPGGSRQPLAPPRSPAGDARRAPDGANLLAMDAAEMEIRFLYRLREERKFDSPELLKEQILRDVSRARRYFRRRRRWVAVRAA